MPIRVLSTLSKYHREAVSLIFFFIIQIYFHALLFIQNRPLLCIFSFKVYRDILILDLKSVGSTDRNHCAISPYFGEYRPSKKLILCLLHSKSHPNFLVGKTRIEMGKKSYNVIKLYIAVQQNSSISKNSF
jgi:hypothetical protein